MPEGFGGDVGAGPAAPDAAGTDGVREEAAMTDLVGFLRDRLAEREAAALAAGGQRWTWHTSHPGLVIAPTGSFAATRIDATSSDLRAHIVLSDPGYVLADVVAKRRVLDWVEAELRDDETQQMPRDIAGYLAAPYVGHPEFDPSWAVRPPRLRPGVEGGRQR